MLDIFEVGEDIEPPTEGVPLFPRSVFLAESVRRHTFGDYFLSSIACILCFNVDGVRDNCQCMGCGKM